MKFAFVAVAAALGMLAFAANCAADTLYKLIDRKGKVTYSETAPKDFDGKVIRIDIDTKANTATLPKPMAKGEARAETEGERVIRRRPDTGAQDRVAAARVRLEGAQKALADARDTATEDDYTLLGNAGGKGTRRVPSEQFALRLAQLEKAVKDAEDALAIAEKGPPL